MATAKKYQHANDKALYDIESTCKAATENAKSNRFSRPLNLFKCRNNRQLALDREHQQNWANAFYQDKQTQAELSKRFYQGKQTQNTQS